LTEFPFADARADENRERVGADESVMLSAIISAIMRAAIGNTPMHCFNAPAARTGKSLAATLVSVISQGRAPPLCTAGKTEEELEKRIDAMLLMSPPFFCIDNIDHPLESAALCVLLTQEEKCIRPLGTSTFQEITFRPFVECTGNNLVLAGDLVGRAIRCTLNAKCELPEFRKIKRTGLLREVKKDRGRYAVAALSIVQAFIHAGAPSQSLPLGSFEKWSAFVRDPLIWLDCADPCASMESIRQESPQRSNLAWVMSAWSEVFGTEQRTARDAIADASVTTHDDELVHKNLHDAFMEVAGGRSGINGYRLGCWLRANKGKVSDGRHFEEAGEFREGARWVLRQPEKKPQ
jgi:hypothetical protein